MLIYPEATLWRLADQEKIFLSAQPLARNRQSVPAAKTSVDSQSRTR
jgi:hypothetical protein